MDLKILRIFKCHFSLILDIQCDCDRNYNRWKAKFFRKKHHGILADNPAFPLIFCLYFCPNSLCIL